MVLYKTQKKKRKSKRAARYGCTYDIKLLLLDRGMWTRESICCFQFWHSTVLEEDSTIATLSICSSRVPMSELCINKSTVFAYHILRFCTLQCAKNFCHILTAEKSKSPATATDSTEKVLYTVSQIKSSIKTQYCLTALSFCYCYPLKNNFTII